MNDARWVDILEAARECASHFRAAARLFERGGFDEPGDEGYGKRMAFLHAMLSGHAAFEEAMLRALAVLDEQPPIGPDWHQLLIGRMARPIPQSRPAILDPMLADAARDTRAFRHFAYHGYRRDFRPERARPAIDAGLLIAGRLEAAILAFARAVDPAEDG